MKQVYILEFANADGHGYIAGVFASSALAQLWVRKHHPMLKDIEWEYDPGQWSLGDWWKLPVPNEGYEYIIQEKEIQTP